VDDDDRRGDDGKGDSSIGGARIGSPIAAGRASIDRGSRSGAGVSAGIGGRDGLGERIAPKDDEEEQGQE